MDDIEYVEAGGEGVPYIPIDAEIDEAVLQDWAREDVLARLRNRIDRWERVKDFLAGKTERAKRAGNELLAAYGGGTAGLFAGTALDTYLAHQLAPALSMHAPMVWIAGGIAGAYAAVRGVRAAQDI